MTVTAHCHRGRVHVQVLGDGFHEIVVAGLFGHVESWYTTDLCEYRTNVILGIMNELCQWTRVGLGLNAPGGAA